MRNAEKIGYVLEHLFALDLQGRGIDVARSERPNNESIKCDLAFLYKKRPYILFLTHTRTQGMTNRKFYRTFEELAQRRIDNPKSLCIDITLVPSRSGVRKQQVLIFDSLFDAAFSVLNRSDESEFVEIVGQLGDEVSLDSTASNIGLFPKKILSSVKSVCDQILAVQRSSNKELVRYWNIEGRVSDGKVDYGTPKGTSVKLGMKMLTFLPVEIISVQEVASGVATVKDLPGGICIESIKKTKLCSEIGPTIGGTRFCFSSNAQTAAKFLIKYGISLSQGWHLEYLMTPGAKLLHQDLTDVSGVEAKMADLSVRLSQCDSAADLAASYMEDFESERLRCDFIDYSLRATSYSQNAISTDILERLTFDISFSDSVVFVLQKSDNLSEHIPDLEEYINELSELVWNRIADGVKSVSADEFIEERIKTYYAHPYVAPERLIIYSICSVLKPAGKTRASILPRLAGLPSKYRMYVVPAAYRLFANGRKLLIITVSTPEERHHKHKEFSGKLRAIRSAWSEGGVGDDSVEFVIVVDGNWTADQLGMLSRSGWRVLDWDTVPEVLEELVSSNL